MNIANRAILERKVNQNGHFNENDNRMCSVITCTCKHKVMLWTSSEMLQ